MQGILQGLSVCMQGQRRDCRHVTDVASDQATLSSSEREKKKRTSLAVSSIKVKPLTFSFRNKHNSTVIVSLLLQIVSDTLSTLAAYLKLSAVQQERPSVYIGSVQLQNHSALEEFWLC